MKPTLRKAKMPQFLVVFVCLLVYSSVTGEQEISTEAEDTPSCTISRIDDAKVLGERVTPPAQGVRTELECAARCEQETICEYATFNNQSKICLLIARNVEPWPMTRGEGCCVVYQKRCPMFDNVNATWPKIICPAEYRAIPAPAKKYAYRRTSWLPNQLDGPWLCRNDQHCVAALREWANDYTTSRMTFYYSTAPDEVGESEMIWFHVRTCRPTGVSARCRVLTAIPDKVVQGGRIYLSRTDYTNRNCAQVCKDSSACYASTMTEISGTRTCRLYKNVPGQQAIQFVNVTSPAKSTLWWRDVTKCTS